ncbi:GNAT family N-acetyltransferase [Paraglaciecola aquimarina]|uniref:GNAT family N-acetyltransferase n=1 Tax=Paraglaciecola aquimarina TaxID=1235557 RepID=A0ABU3SWS9_9ALTE|nr:GNAT family N-acetyltransferase [Paraglaciecola aquimarina]MDU0354438.1 GNAT family N-acetyltransferase [Paraglaciecola aquimarina]
MKVVHVDYRINEKINVNQFYDLLVNSTLGERRPVDDVECLAGMLLNSNLTVSAWVEGKLVGLARSMTDFNYACYLSDLAVNRIYQNRGIGKQLQILTQAQLNKRCKLILISAPTANGYYDKIGFTNNPRCWVLERDSDISI